MKPQAAGDKAEHVTKVGEEVDVKPIAIISTEEVPAVKVVPTVSEQVRDSSNSKPSWTGHYVMSVLTTLCCFGPCSVIGLVHFLSAKAEYSKGNVRDALKRKRQAKVWSWLALTIGLILTVAFVTYVSLFAHNYMNRVTAEKNELKEDIKQEIRDIVRETVTSAARPQLGELNGGTTTEENQKRKEGRRKGRKRGRKNRYRTTTEAYTVTASTPFSRSGFRTAPPTFLYYLLNLPSFGSYQTTDMPWMNSRPTQGSWVTTEFTPTRRRGDRRGSGRRGRGRWNRMTTADMFQPTTTADMFQPTTTTGSTTTDSTWYPTSRQTWARENTGDWVQQTTTPGSTWDPNETSSSTTGSTTSFATNTGVTGATSTVEIIEGTLSPELEELLEEQATDFPMSTTTSGAFTGEDESTTSSTTDVTLPVRAETTTDFMRNAESTTTDIPRSTDISEFPGEIEFTTPVEFDLEPQVTTPVEFNGETTADTTFTTTPGFTEQFFTPITDEFFEDPITTDVFFETTTTRLADRVFVENVTESSSTSSSSTTTAATFNETSTSSSSTTTAQLVNEGISGSTTDSFIVESTPVDSVTEEAPKFVEKFPTPQEQEFGNVELAEVSTDPTAPTNVPTEKIVSNEKLIPPTVSDAVVPPKV